MYMNKALCRIKLGVCPTLPVILYVRVAHTFLLGCASIFEYLLYAFVDEVIDYLVDKLLVFVFTMFVMLPEFRHKIIFYSNMMNHSTSL